MLGPKVSFRILHLWVVSMADRSIVHQQFDSINVFVFLQLVIFRTPQKQSSDSHRSLFILAQQNDLTETQWGNSLCPLNYAVLFTLAQGNIHTLMSLCCVNVRHLAPSNAVRHFFAEALVWKCDPHVVNNKPPLHRASNLHLQMFLFLKSCRTCIAEAKSKLGIVS